MALYAGAAIDVGSAFAADILYHYKIPDEIHCQTGDAVIVPFGKGNRQKIGFVLEITDKKPDFPVKDIQEVMPSVLNPEQLQLIAWLRENTFCTYYDAIKAMLPAAVLRNKRTAKSKAFPAVQNAEPLVLSKEQQEVFDKIAPSLETEKPACFLLRGVTGSGKTCIFEALIARTLQLGKTAMLLLPEISLTPQMIQRFSQKFGENVALMHSRLSDGERKSAYERAKNGSA
ncbi:MAG: DEAD/DEAH box helicase family protein, partial [Oscillospiraceae bacterium]|nr:DEAD/DEAH box helicase family protein [Oscillospiraceae bacterium]